MFVHRPGGLDRILLGHECYALVPAGLCSSLVKMEWFLPKARVGSFL